MIAKLGSQSNKRRIFRSTHKKTNPKVQLNFYAN